MLETLDPHKDIQTTISVWRMENAHGSVSSLF